jgi:8-oxo-dGTP pyrophosphatase MutT (NUDIX family)
MERLLATLAQRPTLRVPRAAGVQEAAVALLLRPRRTIELLLIERAERENDPWSGHIALPGGRRAANDSSLLETALREGTEEIGVPLSRTGRLLGTLDEFAPRSPRLPPVLVAPYVLEVPVRTRIVVNPREVAAALWVPLPALRDEAAIGELLVEFDGGPLAFPSIRYGQHVIWGLTHRILTQFLELAASAGL